MSVFVSGFGDPEWPLAMPRRTPAYEAVLTAWRGGRSTSRTPGPDGLDDALRASTACRRWHVLATADSVHVADENATRGHGRMWAARLRSSSARGVLEVFIRGSGRIIVMWANQGAQGDRRRAGVPRAFTGRIHDAVSVTARGPHRGGSRLGGWWGGCLRRVGLDIDTVRELSPAAAISKSGYDIGGEMYGILRYRVRYRLRYRVRYPT